jgi:hypothetical protein
MSANTCSENLVAFWTISPYHTHMSVFSMRFHWKPGEAEPPRAGPFALEAQEQAGALAEAGRRWEAQPYRQRPRGYRVFRQDGGELVYQHERRQ